MSCLSLRCAVRGNSLCHLYSRVPNLSREKVKIRPHPGPMPTAHVMNKRCISSVRKTLSFSAAQKLVQANLKSVLPVMNENSARKKNADFRDPSWKGSAAEFPWLPSYMVKLDPEERIAGGEVLKEGAKQSNLHLIRIPEQILCPIPGALQSLTHLKALCLSEKVEGVQNKRLTLEQTRQLCMIVKTKKVNDLKGKNLVHCPDGKIAIIDTECFGSIFYGLHSLYENNHFEEDAQKFIDREIRTIRGY